MKHLWRISAYVVVGATSLILLVWACFEYGQFNHLNGNICDERKTYPDEERLPNIDPDRGFDGDKDIYGKGTRIGIYAQWSASLIATIFLDFEQKGLKSAFICFEVATLAAFFFLLFNHGCVFTAECLVLAYFLLGGIAAVLGPDIVAGIMGGRIANRLGAQDFIVMLLVCLVSTINAWFWLRVALVGEDVDFAATPGGTSLFILAHARDEHIRQASYYMGIICIVVAVFTLDKIVGLTITKMRRLPEELPSMLVAFTIIFFAAAFLKMGIVPESHPWTKSIVDRACVCLPWEESWADVRCLGRLRALVEDLCSAWKDAANRHHSTTATHRPSADRSKTNGQRKNRYQEHGPWVKLLSIAVFLIAFTLAILGIELTLAWNNVWHIDTILSPGQIVPLTAGVLVLATVLWDTYHGPWRYGGDYRQKACNASLTNNDGAEQDPSQVNDAKVDNLWRRVSSAIMTPTSYYRDRPSRGARRSQMKKEIVALRWRIFASLGRIRDLEEALSSSQDPAQEPGESTTTPSMTEEMAASVAVSSPGSQHQELQGSPSRQDQQ